MGNFTPFGGLQHMRRRRRMANIVFQQLTPWSEGLAVTAGQYVSSGGDAWIAAANGTTGNTAPVSGQSANDGAVGWTRVDIMSLLQFLYTGVPTP